MIRMVGFLSVGEGIMKGLSKFYYLRWGWIREDVGDKIEKFDFFNGKVCVGK